MGGVFGFTSGRVCVMSGKCKKVFKTTLKVKQHPVIKAKFPFLQHMFYGREGIWSQGYCVSSVGFSEKEILAYVTYQEKEDKGQLTLEL